jgi:tetratricopeptide (TPR) repeat protein
MIARPRRSILALALLLLLAGAAGAERDPEYDKVLKAYTGRRWTDFDRLAPAFLKARPDYEFAHSVRYMIAGGFKQRRRYPEAIAAYREYIRLHPSRKYVERCMAGIVQSLALDERHEEAIAEADAFLEERSDTKDADLVRYERAEALEELRRFDEAIEGYRSVGAKLKEKAAWRTGVALFRGRRFEESRKALDAFLAAYPESRYRKSAEEYRFRTDTGFREIRGGIVLDYEGKYEHDPRFHELRDGLAERRKQALAEIARKVKVRVPRTFLLRFQDTAGSRSGNHAVTRLEVVDGKPQQVVILRTEYFVAEFMDIQRTLVHELYHALQRESLGEGHFAVPKWAREGAAMYVAGQGESRLRTLAAEVGRRSDETDPMARLVDGLGGAHAYEDYAEDVGAFLAAEERHGRAKVVLLLKELLRTADVEKAIRSALKEDLETFERLGAEWTRRKLRPLVVTGRLEIREALRHRRARRWEAAWNALPEDPGAYAPIAAYLRATVLLETGEAEKALKIAREECLGTHRHFTTYADNGIFLEIRALKALGYAGLAEAVERAKRDLEPTGVYPAFRKWLERQSRSE